MLSRIRTKIRALVEDFFKSDFEVFTYTNSAIFTIEQENVVSITKVLKNDVELGSGSWDFDSTTNKITISDVLVTGDELEVDYTYYKYSDSELTEYIRASLVWISTFAHGEDDYELDSTAIVPTPPNKTLDLIALIGGILIRPDYTEYKLPNLTVTYDKRIPKEDRIQKIISRFQYSIGVNATLKFD